MRQLAEIRPDLSRGLIDAVEQALAGDPDARQDSVLEFRRQLVDGEAAPVLADRVGQIRASAA